MSKASIVVFLVRATNEPDSLFQTAGSSPSYSRSRRPRPPDVWWYRTCVAWRPFRTRGRFACRRRTLALLRRHPPTLRRPAPSSKPPKNFGCRDERARRRVGPIFAAPAMASSSSPSQIICVSFNQDNSMFSVGTKDGFKIFDARNGRLCYEKNLGGFNIVEMLFGTNLLAIVGTGEQPAMSPRRLCLFNTKTGASKRDLNFKTSILAVRLSRKRLVVVLHDRTFVYDLNSTTILDEIETVPNTKGLCAFAPNSEECYLALPASTSKGSALVYKASKPELICQIDAHQAPLAAMVFSLNGLYLATASEKGTMIRVHLVAQATKSHSFRRGTYPSTIYSLTFSPSVDLPDVLVATSSSGSLHMFFLDASRNARRQANTLLSSVIPGSVTDALDPANHHVIHHVVTADIKSCLAVHSVENSQNSSKFPALKTVIYIVTHDGYFREYLINTTKSNESSWFLVREFNLLDSCSGSPKQNEQDID